jgi:hypothetical protein
MRAGSFGNVRIVFPMKHNGELAQQRTCLIGAKEELPENLSFNDKSR